MSAATWLITGASRGIGLGFVRHIASEGGIVFAAARSPQSATALQELQAFLPNRDLIHIVQLDVTDTQSIQAAVDTIQGVLQGRGLDYLVNNAGKSEKPYIADAPSTFDPEVMMDVFKTNVVGPAMIYKACIPLLERSKRQGGPVIANIRSNQGSMAFIQGNSLPPGLFVTSYAISKAGLNMLTVKQAKEKPNIITFSLCPGWVKTDMGGEHAPTDVSEAVNQVYGMIIAATGEYSGTFRRYTGETIPW